MRPARAAVIARMERHEWPTTSEIIAMLAESGTAPLDDALVAAEYASAMAAMAAEPTSGEQAVLASLRGWPIQ